MTAETIQEQISKAQSGDGQAFGLVFDELYPGIYRYHWYRCWNRSEAEDLTSQTFLKALEGLASYDPAKGGFKPWLYRLAHNLLVDQYRKKRPEQPIEDAWDLSGDDDVAADAELAETLTELRGYIAELTPEQRNLLLLRVWDGLSYREIAVVLGRTEAACKMGFSRLVAELRDKLVLVLITLITASRLFEI